VDNFSADLLQVNWKEDLLFRVVTLEIQQPSADFVSEISRPNVVKTENYTSQNLCWACLWHFVHLSISMHSAPVP